MCTDCQLYIVRWLGILREYRVILFGRTEICRLFKHHLLTCFMLNRSIHTMLMICNIMVKRMILRFLISSVSCNWHGVSVYKASSINSLVPSDAIWRHEAWWTSARVMGRCRQAACHLAIWQKILQYINDENSDITYYWLQRYLPRANELNQNYSLHTFDNETDVSKSIHVS